MRCAYFRVALITCVCSSLGLLIQPISALSSDEQRDISEFIQTVMDCQHIAGLSLAVVDRGDTVMTDSFGYADVSKNKAFQLDTVTVVSSLTKAFTTTLLAKLLPRYNVTKTHLWDTKVRDILGEDFYFNDTRLTSCVTVGDLAAHRTGVPSHNRLRLQQDFNRDVLTRSVRFLRGVHDLGTSFLYSNIMYGLLVKVTETLTSQPWEASVYEHLLEPLGMRGACFSNNVTTNNRATGYVYLGGLHQAISPDFHSAMAKTGGSGSLNANAFDMARWMNFHLSDAGTNEQGEVVVDPGELRDTKRPHNAIPQGTYSGRGLHRENYGYGWFLGRYRDRPLVHHSGSTYGYNSYISLLPDQQIGIFTAVNTDDPGYAVRGAIHRYIADLLLGDSPTVNISGACNESLRKGYTHVPLGEAELTLEQYTGSYVHHAYGAVLIALEDNNRLMLRYGASVDYQLLPLGGHTFRGVPAGIVMKPIDELYFTNTGNSVVREVDTLVIVDWEKRDPPVFKLNPLPPEPVPQVEPCWKGHMYSLTSAGASIHAGGSLYVILLVCWWCSQLG